jgi:hypothetical protein
MATEPITIEVDAEAARVFNSASQDERRRLAALVSLRLLDAARVTTSLRDLMQEISKNAQERGLTPEKLQELLDDE